MCDPAGHALRRPRAFTSFASLQPGKSFEFTIAPLLKKISALTSVCGRKAGSGARKVVPTVSAIERLGPPGFEIDGPIDDVRPTWVSSPDGTWASAAAGAKIAAAATRATVVGTFRIATPFALPPCCRRLPSWL